MLLGAPTLAIPLHRGPSAQSTGTLNGAVLATPGAGTNHTLLAVTASAKAHAATVAARLNARFKKKNATSFEDVVMLHQWDQWDVKEAPWAMCKRRAMSRALAFGGQAVVNLAGAGIVLTSACGRVSCWQGLEPMGLRR